MKLPRRSADFLERAERLRKQDDAASVMYAALELRCGIEARLQEFVSHAVGISRKQAREWEIKKLGRTLEEAFRTSDTMIILLVTMPNKDVAQFIYAPVTARLQEIGKKCGDFLHVRRDRDDEEEANWTSLRALLHQGCGLLRMACSSEILRPTFDEGIHITLEQGDKRIEAVQALQAGTYLSANVVHIDPVGPITYYPAE